MEISLKKSSALQDVLREEIRKIGIVHGFELSIYASNTEAALEAGRTEMFAAIARRTELSDALFELREKTGAANATAGVDRILTRIAHLKSEQDLYAELSVMQPREAGEIISGRIERLKRDVPQGTSGYGRQADFVSVSLVLAEDRDQFKAKLMELRKQIQGLKDKLLEANVANKITLSPQAVKTLTEAGMI